MRGLLRGALALGFIFTLNGCGLPRFNITKPDSEVHVTTDKVTRHIECEILSAWETQEGKKELSNYVSNINLTFEVTNSDGISPNINFITPYYSPARVQTGSLNIALGGALSESNHRTVNFNFNLDFSDLSDPSKEATMKGKCVGKSGSEQGEGYGIEGALGLADIIKAGLKADEDDSSGHIFSDVPFASSSAKDNPPKVGRIFGSTIDFTLVEGLSASGPTGTIVHFKGPGGTNQGLLNATRTLKNTVVVSFVKFQQNKRTQDRADFVLKLQKRDLSVEDQKLQKKDLDDHDQNTQALKATAAKLATDNTARMILQNILPVQ